MNRLSLVERIVALHDALDAAGIPHAFGGALALAYHVAEVRATKDIDVNIFLTPDDAERVFDAQPQGVATTPADISAVRRDGQVRLRWDDTPVDLFFDLDAIHRQAADHARRVPFAGATIPVLGSTELTVFKMMHSRGKDWVDIEAMLEAHTVDVDAVTATFGRIMGTDHGALKRFVELAGTTA